MSYLTTQPSGLCSFCVKRMATSTWTEGTIAYVHGFAQPVCEVCALEKQLEYARQCIKRVPELKKALEEAKKQPELTKEEIEESIKKQFHGVLNQYPPATGWGNSSS